MENDLLLDTCEVDQTMETSEAVLLFVFRVSRRGALTGVQAIGFGSEEMFEASWAGIMEVCAADNRVVSCTYPISADIARAWHSGERLHRQEVLSRVRSSLRGLLQEIVRACWGYDQPYVPGRWIEQVTEKLMNESVVSC